MRGTKRRGRPLMRRLFLLVFLLGCDDGSAGPLLGPGEACTSSSQCNWALVCVGGVCGDDLQHGGGGSPVPSEPDAADIPPGPDPDAWVQPPLDGAAPPPPPPPDAAPPPPPPDAAPDVPPPPPDAAPGVVCDEASGRAVAPGPFQCAEAPETVTVDGRFQIFRYEASHPTATRDQAFPCARPRGGGLEAPDVQTEACSIRGVRPWHSVRWDDARNACSVVGWRLCTTDELARACGGPQRFAYTWGPEWEPGACNLRESWSVGGVAGPAPAGELPRCVSPEGAFDLTGNLWEWVSASGGADRTHQGAGWRTIAERHRESDLVCTTRTRIVGAVAPAYANSDVGFRCCRSL